MIKIVAEKYVKEEKIKEFLSIVSELISESKKETGCIAYGIYEDISDKTHLTFIEEWTDEVAIGKHVKTEHYTKYIPLLVPLCLKNGSIVKYKEPAI